MTPEKTAKELVEKYYHLFSVELENTIDYREAKQCALIAVNAIMEQLNHLPTTGYGLEYVAVIEYWKEVKQEISKP